MQLVEFEAAQWRNIQHCQLQPSPGINVIWGENAQGKTNIIEGIYYGATLRTFRPGRVAALMQWGSLEAKIRMCARVDQVLTQFEVCLGKQGRRLLVDGTAVNTADDYFGGFNVVLFTPEHLALVRGEPALRRTFMDRALFSVDPGQLGRVRHYNRLLKQRNAVLRQGLERPSHVAELLDALDRQLAESGVTLVTQRLWLLESLSPVVEAIHDRLVGARKRLELVYRMRGVGAGKQETGEPAQLVDQLWDGLRRRRSEDLKRGHTSIGPHHDDMSVRLDGRSARLTASQGEQRTIVLALKLAELSWTHQKRGETPVLLLDDMGSELDPKRRRILFDYLQELEGQTFLTTVTPEIVPDSKNNVYFHIVDGNILPG